MRVVCVCVCVHVCVCDDPSSLYQEVLQMGGVVDYSYDPDEEQWCRFTLKVTRLSCLDIMLHMYVREDMYVHVHLHTYKHTYNGLTNYTLAMLME